MAKKPKRIHINRSDLGVVLILVFIVSGMTFSVGMLLGFGYGEVRGVETYLKEHSQHEGDESHFEESKSEVLAMMDSFNNSKQQALNVLLSQQSKNMQPKSIADAKAYFDQLSEEGAEVAQESEAEVRRAPARVIDEEARIPASIQPLFEASAGASADFVPTPNQWTIQVASYASQEQAEAKLLYLQKNKVSKSYVKNQIMPDGSTWYSVFIGSHSDKAWSNRFAEKLRRRKLIANFKLKKVP